MSVRHSPAVSYPLQRSRMLVGVWLIALLVGMTVLLLWLYMGAGLGQQWAFHAVLAAVAMGICTWCGWKAMRTQALGALRYMDGQWSWIKADHVTAFTGNVHVIVDLPALLLVCLVDEKQCQQRFILEKNWSPSRWADLRRAVYSSVYAPQSPSMSA